MKLYSVYLLTNKNNTVIYTGVTNDLQRRIWEHKFDKGLFLQLQAKAPR